MPTGQIAERQATWLELFFDLVFVAAVAGLGDGLHHDRSLLGLAVFAGLFVPVWWGWWGYTWFSAGFDTDDGVLRFAILAAMVAAAGMAAGVGGAAHGDSDTFVVAYAAFFAVLTALYARAWTRVPAARPLTARYAVGDAAGVTLWLASLAFDESVRPIVWAVAMVVLMGSPVLAARSLSVLSYHPQHIAERYGLFTLIVLGESVVATVGGLDTRATTRAVLTAVLGFAIAAAIWWVYFGRWRGMPAGGIASGWVWAQGHLLIFAGVAATAVGVELCVEAADEGVAPDRADRMILAAGVASYLLAMAAIRAATRRPDPVVALRVATACAGVAVALGAGDVEALPFVAVIAALVVGEAVVEVARAPAPEAGRPRPVLPFEAPTRRG